MNLDFSKNKDGLVPAIIQDNTTHKVLMLGYLNQESLSLTLSTNVVHFYSRTKKRIWKKGEESGNELRVVSIKEDCDIDTLLIKVNFFLHCDQDPINFLVDLILLQFSPYKYPELIISYPFQLLLVQKMNLVNF